MSGNGICCASCQRSWALGATLSIYAEQSIESCPCPHCGAYTLICQSAPAAGRPANAGLLHTFAAPRPTRPSPISA
jgi:hypothetical protein